MADKNKGKMSFDDIQNQMGSLKNIEDELDNVKEKATDVEVHKATAQKVGKTIKEQVMTSLMGVASIALLGILAQMLFPWWTIAIVGFWVGYWIADTPAKSFVYGFLSMFLVWSIYAGYLNGANGGLMSETISGMLGGKLSGTQLIYATGILGGFVTGLATSSGALLRQFLQKEA